MTKAEEYGVQVTRNGYGIHVGTWDQGALSDLDLDQARELLAKLAHEIEEEEVSQAERQAEAASGIPKEYAEP